MTTPPILRTCVSHAFFLLHKILPRRRHRSQAHWCDSQVLMNNIFPTKIGEGPEQSDQLDRSFSCSILTIKHTFNRSRNVKKLVASNCIACKAIVFSGQAILSTYLAFPPFACSYFPISDSMLSRSKESTERVPSKSRPSQLYHIRGNMAKLQK